MVVLVVRLLVLVSISRVSEALLQEVCLEVRVANSREVWALEVRQHRVRSLVDQLLLPVFHKVQVDREVLAQVHDRCSQASRHSSISPPCAIRQ